MAQDFQFVFFLLCAGVLSAVDHPGETGSGHSGVMATMGGTFQYRVCVFIDGTVLFTEFKLLENHFKNLRLDNNTLCICLPILLI